MLELPTIVKMMAEFLIGASKIAVARLLSCEEQSHC